MAGAVRRTSPTSGDATGGTCPARELTSRGAVDRVIWTGSSKVKASKSGISPPMPRSANQASSALTKMSPSPVR